MDENIIVTEDLTREFRTMCAVNQVNISIAYGQTFGLIGPMNAGKTTLIRLLMGFLPPSTGSAMVLGYNIRTDPASIRRRAEVLLEHSGLYEHLSAEDNLEFYGRVCGMTPASIRAQTGTLLQQFNLWGFRKDKVRDWPPGLKRKLAIARLLLRRPALIFLDEPTAGLNTLEAEAIEQDLRQLVNRGDLTVVLATQDLDFAQKLCDTVAVLDRGNLLYAGPMGALLDSHFTSGQLRSTPDYLGTVLSRLTAGNNAST